MTRFSLAALAAWAVAGAMPAFDKAHAADPYRWCADYTVLGGIGARNCYFMTLEQCRAAVSGVGGMCVPNPFYDGAPERASRPAKQTKPRT